MTHPPTPRATTREQMVEALVGLRDRYHHQDGAHDLDDIDRLIDLASRLPSPPAASESRECERPHIDQCMMHRCIPHLYAPQLNSTVYNGAECGACAAGECRVAHEATRAMLQAGGNAMARGWDSGDGWETYARRCYTAMERARVAAAAEPAAGEGVGRERLMDALYAIDRFTDDPVWVAGDLAMELLARGLSLDEVVKVATGGTDGD